MNGCPTHGTEADRSCFLCWKFWHEPAYNQQWGGTGVLLPGQQWPKPEVHGPSFAKKVANFAGAVVDHVAAGMPLVSNEDKERRLSICRSGCPEYIVEKNSCRHPNCGCNLEIKASWAEQRCPLGKWPKRHLLYHVLPVRGYGVWQRNLEQLAARLHLFNGERIIAIATDTWTDDAEAVKAKLAGHRIEWIVTRNQGALREMATWASLWERLSVSAGYDDHVFYYHAKGVTHPDNPGVSVHRWAQLLYTLNLDFWPLVERALQDHPIVGAFQKVGGGFAGSPSTWHYSGTCYWVRWRDAKDKWQKAEQVWFGNESWPGIAWKPEEGACLFHKGSVPELNLYSLDYIRQVEAEFEEWKLKNIENRTVTG